MFQTTMMAAAAVQFVAIACLFNPARFFHILMFQFLPGVLALALSVCAFGRYMGWPV